mgnify:CR=1 FL=1
MLFRSINQRVDIMIKNGLIEETKYLINKAPIDCQSMKAIGYKEIVPYIEHKDSLENCVNLLKQKTRNYAKRQITFMKTMPYLVGCTKENIVEKVREFLND